MNPIGGGGGGGMGMMGGAGAGAGGANLNQWPNLGVPPVARIHPTMGTGAPNDPFVIPLPGDAPAFQPPGSSVLDNLLKFDIDLSLPDCEPWQAPAAPGSLRGPFWVIGCVQAVGGLQCGPTSTSLTRTPTCKIPQWNPRCVNDQAWLSERIGPDLQNRFITVNIYGCTGTDPSNFRCPTTVQSNGVRVPETVNESCFQEIRQLSTEEESKATPTHVWLPFKSILHFGVVLLQVSLLLHCA